MTPARTRNLAAIGDVTIDLVAEGVGSTVVLLPSKARDSLDFDAVAAGLAAAGHRVLRPQPRGALGSRGPTEAVTLASLAADIAHVIEREGTGPAIVVGHAFGNWIARVLATNHPHLVRGIVLAAAAAASYPAEQRADVRTCSDPSRPEPERLAALRRSFFAPGSDAREWLTGWHSAAALIQDKAVAASPREGWWNAGTAPVLDLIAEFDPFRPRATWDETAVLLGSDRVTVATIPGVSHALFPEAPDAVVAAIVAWARGLP